MSHGHRHRNMTTYIALPGRFELFVIVLCFVFISPSNRVACLLINVMVDG